MLGKTKSRLLEIRNELEELQDELKTILRTELDAEDKYIYERAKAYWLTYLEYAVVGDGFKDSFASMNNTLKELGIDLDADPEYMEDDDEEDSGDDEGDINEDEDD